MSIVRVKNKIGEGIKDKMRIRMKKLEYIYSKMNIFSQNIKKRI
jgi:hypothetical protein